MVLDLSPLLESDASGFALRHEAMRLLETLPGYDWCGIYRLEGDELHLDAYVGAPTDHDRIKVGVGVCGTAVAQDKNQIVDDVNALENYLSCSISTKSEIVVLVRSEDGIVLGQIDIDSHQPARFTAEDEQMLEALGAILAARW